MVAISYEEGSYDRKHTYCIVSIHLYSASYSAHQSETLPVRETQREEKAVLRERKACTWET